jgi:hypothetical protein
LTRTPARAKKRIKEIFRGTATVSAVVALANPRRIKASHRRRRRVASDHLLYILNNPLSGTDPTGYTSCNANGDAADCANAAGPGGEAKVYQQNAGSHIKTTVGSVKNNGDGSATFTNNAGQSKTFGGGNGSPSGQGTTGTSSRQNQAASAGEKNAATNASTSNVQGGNGSNPADRFLPGSMSSGRNDEESAFRVGAGKDGTAWPKRTISSVGAPTEEIAQWMLSPDPDEKMKAVHAAIEHFNIRGSGYSLFYAPTMDWATASSNPWGNIELGPLSFRSWSDLGVTLGHEIEIHWEKQYKVNGAVTDGMYSQEWYMREVEADRYEIGNARRFGLSASQVANSRKWLDDHYGHLSARNKKMVDMEMYELP